MIRFMEFKINSFSVGHVYVRQEIMIIYVLWNKLSLLQYLICLVLEEYCVRRSLEEKLNEENKMLNFDCERTLVLLIIK